MPSFYAQKRNRSKSDKAVKVIPIPQPTPEELAQKAAIAAVKEAKKAAKAIRREIFLENKKTGGDLSRLRRSFRSTGRDEKMSY
jgi:hypothetical protein